MGVERVETCATCLVNLNSLVMRSSLEFSIDLSQKRVEFFKLSGVSLMKFQYMTALST